MTFELLLSRTRSPLLLSHDYFDVLLFQHTAFYSQQSILPSPPYSLQQDIWPESSPFRCIQRRLPNFMTFCSILWINSTVIAVPSAIWGGISRAKRPWHGRNRSQIRIPRHDYFGLGSAGTPSNKLDQATGVEEQHAGRRPQHRHYRYSNKYRYLKKVLNSTPYPEFADLSPSGHPELYDLSSSEKSIVLFY